MYSFKNLTIVWWAVLLVLLGEQGSSFAEHWAFVPPKQVELPNVESAVGKSDHPIDRIVGARLEHEGMTPSATARPEILCRRIFLDLIGLPPTPNEVDRFVEAARKNLSSAVNTLLDRLMASPHFGEKWAMHWLDVARYSDSNGYEKDMPREQWPWRDWVVNAINDDLPYDRFLLEQFAGDLLPDATQDHVIATGFLRNSMINEEGAIVPEEFRMEAMFDRMDCMGKAVLGLTTQCAQCHDHKYDPITQKEYFGMFAFFNDTHERVGPIYSEDQLSKIEQINDAVQQINEHVKAARPNWRQEVAEWEAAQAPLHDHWQTIETYDETWVDGLNHPRSLADHSVVMLGHPSTEGNLYVRAQPDLKGVTGLRLEALTYGDLPRGGPGHNPTGSFVVSQLLAKAKPPGSDGWIDLELKNATADFSRPEQAFASLPLAQVDEDNKQVVGPVKFLIDGEDDTAWYPNRGEGRRNTPSVAAVEFAEPLDFPDGTEFRVNLLFRHYLGGDLRGILVLGRFRLALTKSPGPRATPFDHAATLALSKPAEMRTQGERRAIFTAWRKSIEELEALEQEIDGLYAGFPDAPDIGRFFSLSQRPREHQRDTFVLDGGIWDQPLDKVGPHVPSVLHPLKETGDPPRLEFARWLVDRRSPLTARVQVNRVWQAMFGTGLVETSEDFGTRAPRPEYQELIDWLAVDFMNHDWRLKNLLRTIVTSATYQQSSYAQPALYREDPNNSLLARGPRFRAEAEVVRDVALSISGLLHPTMGGQSIFPPVPQSVLRYNYSYPHYWKEPTGPERYRRALYVFRKRSMPDPVLSTFDAPNGDTACARRLRSNSPLAALAGLNEPIFVEAARAMALRVLEDGGATDPERADYAYRLCTSRCATTKEVAELLALLEGQRTRLAEGWLPINELATGDPAKRPILPPDTTPQDVAAWTLVSRVMLNLDETLCKN